jgi:hypothetical protein
VISLTANTGAVVVVVGDVVAGDVVGGDAVVSDTASDESGPAKANSLPQLAARKHNNISPIRD